MRRRPRLSLAALVLLCLAGGCTDEAPPYRTALGEPVVVPSFVTQRVDFRRGTAAPVSGSGERLAAFLAANRVGRGDRATIVAGGAADSLSRERAAETAALLGAYGVRTSVLQDAAALAGEVTVRLDHSWVVTPGCPDWTDGPAQRWTNSPSPNLGCATAQNLAAEIAHPADLLGGEVPDPARAPASLRRGRGGGGGLGGDGGGSGAGADGQGGLGGGLGSGMGDAGSALGGGR
jgi:pilus assembly protein CpaD